MKNKQVYRSGIVSIVGRPSTGKSSLVNRLCGHMVAIVSPLPQTTNNIIRGIVQRKSGQIVFCDTPGFHNSERPMNKHLRKVTMKSLQGIDSVLYVIDCTREPGTEEDDLARVIGELACPVFVAINKIDCLADKKVPETLLSFVQSKITAAEILPISVHEGDNVETLTSLLIASLPLHDPLYPDDVYTDQEPAFRISEIVRGQAWKLLRNELPYSIFVDVYNVHRKKSGTLAVYATIFVERESQKGTVVGKGGTVIGQIRKGSEKELSKIFSYQILLHLRVQVSPKWRRNTTFLKRRLH